MTGEENKKVGMGAFNSPTYLWNNPMISKLISKNPIVKKEVQEEKKETPYWKRLGAAMALFNINPYVLPAVVGKKVVQNLSENVDPYSYDSFDYGSGRDIDWTSRGIAAGLLGRKEFNRTKTEELAQKGENTFGEKSNEPKVRLDLLNLWAGKPQKYGTMQPSQFRPSVGDNPSNQYLSSKAIESDILNNMFSNETAKKIISSGIRNEDDLKKLITETGLPYSATGKGGTSMTVPGLGQATLGVGKDDKGVYLSYYDSWDINPTSGTSSTSKKDWMKKIMSKGEEMGVFSSPKIYGRIYFDQKTGKPISQ